MKERILAARYGEAFVRSTKDTIGVQKTIEELKKVKSILRDNPEFEEFLVSREITYNDKCAFLDNVFKEILPEEIRQFLKFLLEKDRIDLIVAIADYIRVKYLRGEAVDAVLKTTFPLDLELIEQIRDKLEKKLKKKLSLFIDWDSELLGGVEVTVGNYIIDGSVRKRLDDIRRKFKEIRIA